MTKINYRDEGLESINDYIRWGASLFNKTKLYFGHGTNNAFDEARLLILHTLTLPWDLDDIYLNSRLSVQEKSQIVAVFKKRIETRKPSAYLTGEMWFAGLKFFVNEATLVPRSPFAEIILNDFYGWVDSADVKHTLDMCTGSGCIGIAALQTLNNTKLDLVDISQAALQVAQQNVALYQLENNTEVIQSDLFANLQGKKYDLILSNPPYVDAIEMQALEMEFKREPSIGLDGGKDGLEIVQRLLKEASEHLTQNGVLMVEVGVSKYYLEKLYPEIPFYWFEFKNGGEGIFAIHKAELDIYI